MEEQKVIKIEAGENLKALRRALEKNTRWKKIDSSIGVIVGLLCLFLGAVLLIKG